MDDEDRQHLDLIGRGKSLRVRPAGVHPGRECGQDGDCGQHSHPLHLHVGFPFCGGANRRPPVSLSPSVGPTQCARVRGPGILAGFTANRLTRGTGMKLLGGERLIIRNTASRHKFSAEVGRAPPCRWHCQEAPGRLKVFQSEQLTEASASADWQLRSEDPPGGYLPNRVLRDFSARRFRRATPPSRPRLSLSSASSRQASMPLPGASDLQMHTPCHSDLRRSRDGNHGRQKCGSHLQEKL